MTNKKTKRAPAKSPRSKLPAKVPAAPKPEPDVKTPDEEEDKQVEPQLGVLVQPLSEQVFQLLMQIIDNTDFKGREVNQVIAVKLELARVAGLRTAPQQLGNGQ